MPEGLENELGMAVVQELHRHIADTFAFVEKRQPVVAGDLSDDGRLPVLAGKKMYYLVHLFRRDGQDHPFLGLGYPDFCVGKTGVLEWHLVEVHAYRGWFTHLAH